MTSAIVKYSNKKFGQDFYRGRRSEYTDGMRVTPPCVPYRTGDYSRSVGVGST